MQIMYKSRSLGYVETEDAIWFSNRHFNGLEKVNKSTGRIELIKKFPEHNIRKQDLHSYVVYVKKNLIFIPNVGEYITVFDTVTNDFITVTLNLEILGKKAYFSSACVYKNYVYIFPNRARKILRYDVDLKTVTYLNALDMILDKIPKNTEIFMQQYEIKDGKVYFPFASFNGILILDLETEKANICELEIDGGCSTISYLKGNFYMASSKKKEIYFWDEEGGDIVAYDMFPEEFDGKECDSYFYYFGHSRVLGEKVVFLPIFGNMILSFDTVSKKICKEYKIENLHYEKWNTFWALSREERILIMLAGKDDFFYINNVNGELLFEVAFEQDYNYNKQIINNYLMKKHYYNGEIENKGELKDFIEFVQHSENPIDEQKEKNCGKDIYDIIQIQI